MALLPPLEAEEYSTRQCLIEAVQAHAAAEGYTITIRHSNNATKTTYLGCDRGGVYRNRNNLHNGNRQRDTASRLVGCPFSIRALEQDNVWTLKVRNADHNHPATDVTAAHPVQRRLPSDVKKQIKDLSASGVAPSQIISTI
jgi:malonate-semialdehyde dehydrogenase (acetylating) / methylmalonate-semialdehyde dehydrogenase